MCIQPSGLCMDEALLSVIVLIFKPNTSVFHPRYMCQCWFVEGQPWLDFCQWCNGSLSVHEWVDKPMVQ